MFNISTKYSQNFDFRAILTSKNSNLKNINNLIITNSANQLRDKASKNKRGFTFISNIKNSKFSNIYFFNLDDKKKDYEYQDIGGQIVHEALAIKKNKIEILIDTLPKTLLKKNILENIFIGMLSRNYVFDNYKQIKGY